jgi:hypothetical protein
MNKSRLMFASLLAGSMVVSAIGLVSGASTTKSLSTNYTLVNFNAASGGTVSAQYVREDGTIWDTKTFTITAGGQKIVRQYDAADVNTPGSAGKGSLVISADQPLGAVAQVQAVYPGSSETIQTSGAYAGFSSGAPSFSAPLVSRQGTSASGLTNSQLMIQNTGTAATDVVITLSPLPGTANQSSATITKTALAAGTTWYLDLDDDAGAVGLGIGWFGSATVNATSVGGQVAVVSSFFTGANAMQTYNAFPAAGAATTIYAPNVFARLANGLSTPVTIQNLSGTPIAAGDAFLVCVGDPSSTATPATFTLTNTAAIANGGSFAWNPVTNLSFPTTWFGACKVTVPGNVVSFVQIRTITNGTNNPDDAAAYEGIPAGGTDRQVIMPLMTRQLPNGFLTVGTIQNLMNVTNTVTLAYTGAANGVPANATFTVDIPAEGSLIQNLRTGVGLPGTFAGLPAEWVGSLKVTSATGPIAGYVQLRNVVRTVGDNFMAHNAFTQP